MAESKLKMICAHFLFREPSPAPATSKNKWVSAFKSVRGKADTVRWVGQGEAFCIHMLLMFRSRSRVRAGQPPHKQKQLLKTLSSSQLDRDQATTSSTSSTSTLVTAEQEKVPGAQHQHHLTVETAARCSASGEHIQTML